MNRDDKNKEQYLEEVLYEKGIDIDQLQYIKGFFRGKPSFWKTIYAEHRRGELNQREIAESIQKSQPTVSRIIEQVEEIFRDETS